MTETTYSHGDLVEAVRDDTVIRGRASASFGKHLLGLSGRIMEELEENGFTLTVIEKAAPKNVLPTEWGYYLSDFDPSRGVWELGSGGWISPEGVYITPTGAGSFTRLEPVPVTAAKVINAVVANVDPQLGEYWHDKIREVGKQFGVGVSS